LKKIAIIVAGGSGQRMNMSVPKQFLLLQNKPILFHTMAAFKSAIPSIELILVLPINQFDYWKDLGTQYPEIHTQTPHKLVAGGETRFHSSLAGIQSIEESSACLVAIHDGVRPLIEKATIQNAFKEAEMHGNAVVAVPSKDSIRQWNEASTRFEAVPREEIRLIQTPQIFRIESLINSFSVGYQSYFTDDASVVEHAGEKIHLVAGTYSNIKITTPEDLALAEILKVASYE
jgi:2-C-methyl-D-erythritol 4-phosphate cytidylyltransferase